MTHRSPPTAPRARATCVLCTLATSALALTTFALALGPTPILAQSPQPADQPAIPKPTCEKPEWPGRLASENQNRAFVRKRDAYTECIKKYVSEHQALANAQAEAAKAAVDEYNKFVEELNAQIQPKQ
jgi:hypothetical protein